MFNSVELPLVTIHMGLLTYNCSVLGHIPHWRKCQHNWWHLATGPYVLQGVFTCLRMILYFDLHSNVPSLRTEIKDKTYNLGPALKQMLKELQFGFSQKKTKKKNEVCRVSGRSSTQAPADPGRKWIPEATMKTLSWLNSEAVWDSISFGPQEQRSHAGKSYFLSPNSLFL